MSLGCLFVPVTDVCDGRDDQERVWGWRCQKLIKDRLTINAIDCVDGMTQNHGGLRAERTDHVDELDDTEAAFTALVFGNE